MQLGTTITPDDKTSYYQNKIFFTNGAFHANTQCVYCSVLNGKLDMAHKFVSENDVGQSGITSDNIAEFYAVQSLSAYAIGDYKNALNYGIKGFYQGIIFVLCFVIIIFYFSPKGMFKENTDRSTTVFIACPCRNSSF